MELYRQSLKAFRRVDHFSIQQRLHHSIPSLLEYDDECSSFFSSLKSLGNFILSYCFLMSYLDVGVDDDAFSADTLLAIMKYTSGLTRLELKTGIREEWKQLFNYHFHLGMF